MRLYEFTDPTKYLLPETDAADLLKLTESALADDSTDNVANRHLKKKPEIRKPTDWTITSAASQITVLPEEPCPQPL